LIKNTSTAMKQTRTSRMTAATGMITAVNAPPQGQQTRYAEQRESVLSQCTLSYVEVCGRLEPIVIVEASLDELALTKLSQY
jgi:hypothetical protein